MLDHLKRLSSEARDKGLANKYWALGISGLGADKKEEKRERILAALSQSLEEANEERRQKEGKLLAQWKKKLEQKKTRQQKSKKEKPPPAPPEMCAILQQQLTIEAKDRKKKSPCWVPHPAPTVNEPDLRILWLNHRPSVARCVQEWHYHASLNPANRLFNAMRERMRSLRRPGSSASRLGKRTYKSSSADPETVVDEFWIYLCFWNYCIDYDWGEEPEETPKATRAEKMGCRTWAGSRTSRDVLAFRVPYPNDPNPALEAV